MATRIVRVADFLSPTSKAVLQQRIQRYLAVTRKENLPIIRSPAFRIQNYTQDSSYVPFKIPETIPLNSNSKSVYQSEIISTLDYSLGYTDTDDSVESYPNLFNSALNQAEKGHVKSSGIRYYNYRHYSKCSGGNAIKAKEAKPDSEINCPKDNKNDLKNKPCIKQKKPIFDEDDDCPNKDDEEPSDCEPPANSKRKPKKSPCDKGKENDEKDGKGSDNKKKDSSEDPECEKSASKASESKESKSKESKSKECESKESKSKESKSKECESKESSGKKSDSKGSTSKESVGKKSASKESKSKKCSKSSGDRKENKKKSSDDGKKEEKKSASVNAAPKVDLSKKACEAARAAGMPKKDNKPAPKKSSAGGGTGAGGGGGGASGVGAGASGDSKKTGPDQTCARANSGAKNTPNKDAKTPEKKKRFWQLWLAPFTNYFGRSK